MKEAQLRGYILEYAVAKMIEINGYKIINQEDNKEIFKRWNGLNIKGRGGYHQFDVLGHSSIAMPLIYPIRLFIEAKFTKKPTQINIVRNGIGILEDINTNFSTVDSDHEDLAVPKYDYHYAIFSASGFSEEAQKFAIAHKIHLIDLSHDYFEPLLKNISSLAKIIISKKIFVEKKRSALKNILFEEDGLIDNSLFDNEEQEKILELKKETTERYIYFANVQSSLVIPLFSNDKINRKLYEEPNRYVSINIRKNINKEKDNFLFDISFRDEENNGDDKLPHLIFCALPKIFYDILIKNNQISEYTINKKEEFLNRFSFLLFYDWHSPKLCTLEFRREYLEKK